jgi:hypothetical protein
VDPLLFTDPTGRAWHVYDFKDAEARRRAVPLNSWTADARAFVAIDDGDVMIYRYGYVAYHVTAPKILTVG